MEQPADDRNLNAGCSNIKRTRLSEDQNMHVREEHQSDDDLAIVKSIEAFRDIETTTEQMQNVEANAITDAVQNEFNKIGTNSFQEDDEHNKRTNSNLETINEDCLREILKYLDIMDIVNLAKVSERLLNFSETIIFPVATRKIRVNGFKSYRLRTPLYNRCTKQLTLQCVNAAFRCFGKFVEDLTIEYVRSPTENILLNCNNLKKLCIRNSTFWLTEITNVQNRIQSFEYLTELKLLNCIGITEFWFRDSKSISKVVKLHIDTGTGVTRDFLDYFKNLESLTFNCHFWKIADIVRMFGNSSDSLRHLRITSISKNVSRRDAVARLISETLPKLDYLEFEIYLNDETTFLLAMPLLKSLEIICETDYIVNAQLRTLSENGIIEELIIRGGACIESVAQPPPLAFNKLRKLTWIGHVSFSGILKTITKAKMPKIQAIRFSAIENHDFDDLYKLIESKMTLGSITLRFDNCGASLAFWRQICGLLKESSEPRRQFLSFLIAPFRLEAEVVSKIIFHNYVF